MGAEERMVVPRERWGTWEELVLGGAVLRHGTRDWDTVASELRARTIYPHSFTPEVCKAKYEDLQQYYSGCTAWFEELRKKRVAELRRELEKSEDSIGSLASKLESLKAEKGYYGQLDYGSSQTESPMPLLRSGGVEYYSKETSKDGLSAGSFTDDTGTNWSPVRHIPAIASAAEMEIKPKVSGSFEKEKISGIKKLSQTINEQVGTFRKRRGKRKRKDCNTELKEASVEVSETNGATTSHCKENLTSDCGQTVGSSSISDRIRGSIGVKNVDLRRIFDIIAENEYALVFRHRLDSQKRARYRKTIRQHMDFDTIRSRIANCSIMSVEQLFRDMLLLANNALVFYSKRTREYKSAMFLRDHVTKAYHQQVQYSGNKVPFAILSISSICSPPVKPRSFRPCKRRLPGKIPGTLIVIADGSLQGCEIQSNADSIPSAKSLVMAKKGLVSGVKVGPKSGNRRPKTPIKERKRTRQK